MKRTFLFIPFFILTFSLSGPCLSESERDDFFLKFGPGTGISLLNNLSDELERQGREIPFPEYSVSVSIGKTFFNNSIRAEGSFGFSLIQDIRYKNEYEDFQETMSHYDFSLLIRKMLLPERESFSPSLGVGAGYGRTNLVEGGGRLETYEIIGSFQVESRIRDNMDIFCELFYVRGLNQDRFSSPYLDNVSSDVILNSSGEPLEDKYGVAGFRIGITIWLKLPEGRY